MKITATLLLVFICIKSMAQNFSYEFKLGLREELVNENILSGNIENVKQSLPVVGVEIIKNQNGNIALPFGVFIQNYAGRTLIEGSDLGATINRNWFLGLTGGLEYFVLKNRKINFSLGVNQQVLFIPNSKNQIANGLFPKDASPENSIKSETVRGFRTVNPISQFAAKIWLPLPNKVAIFCGYSYNLGWNNLFEREINYKLEDTSGSVKTGNGEFVTNGSGLQANFGIRINMPNN